MCQQQQQQQVQFVNHNNNNTCDKSKKMKPTYSIKKVLKTLFKKEQKQQQQQQQNQQHFVNKLSNSLESLESLDNLRNSQVEEQFYEEIGENFANEKLANIAAEQQQQQHEEEDIYVPVRFARTEAGTFFWTTNLQPVFSTINPAADEDLLQPAYCYSNSQYPHMQYQDRWAQA